MNDCKICRYYHSLEPGEEKDRLRVELSKNSTIPGERLDQDLTKTGFKVSASSIRNHRRSTHDLDEKPSAEEVQNRSENKTPAGWEPFAEFTDSIGSAIVRLPTPKATARDLLISAGFDPDSWQISGPINTRRWMRYDQEWLYYYKFDVVAGESPEIVEEHVDDLVKHIRKRKHKAPAILRPGTDSFAFNASDWQIGKREGNDGTPQTIERVLTSIDMGVERVKELRKQGRKMPELLFTGLGDIGEGTCGFYPGQQFLIDRNRRDQGRINRELITTALDALTPLFDKTIVAVVGGNHGENRSPKGERMTSDGDNDDCAYFDAVKEAFDRAGTTNIDWRIMEDELSMSVYSGEVSVGLTHGHLFERGRGGTAQQKAHEWWKGQDFGFQAVRGTRILISAHFHHFSVITHGARTHLQTPAMDPGSKWFRQSSGEDSPPGTLTLRLDGETALGWDDLSVLTPYI